MNKGKIFLIVAVVILLLVCAFIGGFYVKGSMKDKCKEQPVTKTEEVVEEKPAETINSEEQKNAETPAESNSVDEKELRNTIQKVYEKAYSELYVQFDLEEAKTEKIDFYGKKYSMKLIDTTKLKQYFTANELEEVLTKYSNYEKNGKYYYGLSDEDWPSDLQTYDFFDPGTIFSATDSGERDLEIRTYTSDYILAQGKMTINEYVDFGGEYIVFRKENGLWKIDMFE